MQPHDFKLEYAGLSIDLSGNVINIVGSPTGQGINTLSGDFTVTGTLVSTGPFTIGDITLTNAASKLIPGATSFSIRNHANTLDNFLITDAGNATLAGTFSLSTAASRIIGGATSLSLRDNANANDNVLVSNAGAVTVRSTLSTTGGSIVVGGTTSILTFQKESNHTIQLLDSTTTTVAGGSLTIQAGSGGAGVANGGILILRGGAAFSTGTSGYVNIPVGGGGLLVQDANIVTSMANASQSAVYVSGAAPSTNSHQFGLSVDCALNPTGTNSNDGGAAVFELFVPNGIFVKTGVGIKIQPPALLNNGGASPTCTTIDGILIQTQDPASTFDPRVVSGGGTATNVNGIEIQNIIHGSTTNHAIQITAVGAVGDAGVIGVNIGTLLGVATGTVPIGLQITSGANAGGANCIVLNPGSYTAVTQETSDFTLNSHTMVITGGYASQRSALFAQTTISAATSQTITAAINVAIGGAPTMAGAGPAAATSVFALGILGTGATVTNIAGTVYGSINVANHTVTLSTATGITSANGVAAQHLGVITYSAASATVITNAATLDIVGPPVMSGAGPASATNLSAIRVQAGSIARGFTTLAFSGAISVTVTTADVFKVACTSNTISTLTPSGNGVNGQEMSIIITADGTGGNVLTFGGSFKSAGNLTTTASKGHTICFVSDGTNWWETRRILAL